MEYVLCEVEFHASSGQSVPSAVRFHLLP